jgi:ABC-type transporter Mla MlaB component
VRGGARRPHGHRAGRAGVLIAALLAVGGLLIALATHRDGAPANPNSAIFVSVPPLTGPASTDATVPPFISAAAGADRPGPTEGGGLDTNPLTVEDDPATAAPWPAPPADPSAAVDAALADAQHIDIDLRELEFLDSSGLRVIVEIHNAAEERGFTYRIIPGPPQVHRTFVLTGLDKVLVFASQS